MRRFLASFAFLGLFLIALAPAQAATTTFYAGDTFYSAKTILNEQLVYAPLQNGVTYEMLRNQVGCCSTDVLVALTVPANVDPATVTIQSGESTYKTTLSTGATVYITSLNGVLYTEDQIGTMADRIGEMADRIVYTEQLIVQTATLIVDVTRFSQDNFLTLVNSFNPVNLLAK